MRILHQEKTPEAKAYDALVQRVSPHSNAGSTAVALLKAFAVGGLICCVGQALHDLGAGPLGLEEKAVSAFTSTALIFLSALLTGLGLYDRIGKFAGAGSVVPITGFANSVVSPAMEFRREGFVLGVGAKMFVVAGPVLVYGISASVLYGVIEYCIRLVQGG